jgi:transporter family-2 protein
LSLSTHILALLLAATAGLAMAVQGSLNAILGKCTGIWVSMLIVHALATATVLLTLLFWPPTRDGGLSRLLCAPWYAYLGGLIAVLITYGVIVTIPKLGVATATTAIIVGQVGTAAVIDHFGLFGLREVQFTLIKLFGVVLLAFGARLLLN